MRGEPRVALGRIGIDPCAGVVADQLHLGTSAYPPSSSLWWHWKNPSRQGFNPCGHGVVRPHDIYKDRATTAVTGCRSATVTIANHPLTLDSLTAGEKRGSGWKKEKLGLGFALAVVDSDSTEIARTDSRSLLPVGFRSCDLR
ncbi:hypothetical protein E2562_009531 [Oryza meyeriana var. granulata]|uniref:Uncharacterized protein n=1 Tax=Oryza meyeriana var. granulata TaxID=110450 RepID=A0A6G1F5X2_9ORYZ|nr:hypothetical protein E2562_009531 [Oryza meyeriana var. granulata]